MPPTKPVTESDSGDTLQGQTRDARNWLQRAGRGLSVGHGRWMMLMMCAALSTLPAATVAAQKKGERVRVLAGSVMRTAPGGQVIGVLSRTFEGPVEMVQGSAVRLRINGFVSEKAVRLEANRSRGLVGGAGASGGVLRMGPSEKEPELAMLRRGAVVFSGQAASTFLAVNRTVWVDKSRLAKLSTSKIGTAPPPKNAAAPSPKNAAAAPTKTMAATASTTAGRTPASGTPKPTEKPEPAPGAAPPAKTSAAVSTPVTTLTIVELSAARLRADPRGTKGKVVQWIVEALSYQLADGLRRELNGEPYLLARGPGKERAILYLAVPDSLVPAARALAPLSTVTVTARVRSGKSEPGGVPILDLLELVRR